MALDVKLKQLAFSRTVETLAGMPNRSLLRELISSMACSGTSYYVNAMGSPLDEETRVGNTTYPEAFDALSSIRTTRVHEDAASFNETNRRLTETPHMEGRRQRTLLTPAIAEAGYRFNEIDPIEEIIDLKGPTVAELMRRLYLSVDKKIVGGIFAPSVQRVAGASQVTATEAIAFPPSQKLVLTYADFAGKFTKDAFALIREKFQNRYQWGAEPVTVLVSPKLERQLIEESGSQIHSRDFVSAAGYFERGEIPEIYGCRVVCHPLVGDNEFAAFQASGVRLGQFKGLSSSMAEDPNRRFETIAYIREYLDVKRIDDFKVVLGVVDQANTGGTQTN